MLEEGRGGEEGGTAAREAARGAATAAGEVWGRWRMNTQTVVQPASRYQRPSSDKSGASEHMDIRYKRAQPHIVEVTRSGIDVTDLCVTAAATKSSLPANLIAIDAHPLPSPAHAHVGAAVELPNVATPVVVDACPLLPMDVSSAVQAFHPGHVITRFAFKVSERRTFSCASVRRAPSLGFEMRGMSDVRLLLPIFTSPSLPFLPPLQVFGVRPDQLPVDLKAEVLAAVTGMLARVFREVVLKLISFALVELMDPFPSKRKPLSYHALMSPHSTYLAHSRAHCAGGSCAQWLHPPHHRPAAQRRGAAAPAGLWRFAR